MFYKKPSFLFLVSASIFSLVACNNSPLSKGAPLEIQTLWEKRIEGSFYIGDWAAVDTNAQTFFLASTIQNDTKPAPSLEELKDGDSLFAKIKDITDGSLQLSIYEQNGTVKWQRKSDGRPCTNGTNNSFWLYPNLGEHPQEDYHFYTNGRIDTVKFPADFAKKRNNFLSVKQPNKVLFFPNDKREENVWAVTRGKFEQLPSKFKIELGSKNYFSLPEASIAPNNPNYQLLIIEKNADTSLLVATDSNGTTLWQYPFLSHIHHWSAIAIQTHRNIFWTNDGGVLIISKSPENYRVLITKLNNRGEVLFTTPAMSDGVIALRSPVSSLQVFEDNSFLFVGATSTKKDEHFTLFRYDANGRLLWLKEHPIKLSTGQRFECLEFTRTRAGKFATIMQLVTKEPTKEVNNCKTEVRLVIFTEQGDWEKDAILPTLSFSDFQDLSVERVKLAQMKGQNWFLCAWLGHGRNEHQIILQNIQLQEGTKK